MRKPVPANSCASRSYPRDYASNVVGNGQPDRISSTGYNRQIYAPRRDAVDVDPNLLGCS